ncbi:alpha/beta hydrolase [Noviherbaspirillum sp. CPCC 100848]|uniref:Alpha/beta hydrolase n=2 Tax=Noviherbaspirillum album TaxID=3080276 RepID=A0ABU6J8B3_9BURK|nr:alpha/beta hydrolase [Noviherbaspirillum sp. CPCC 100848]MEC4719900.1 alpha/beta hydrolase [Noviherbaspirillum sp. CPCC 100848]
MNKSSLLPRSFTHVMAKAVVPAALLLAGCGGSDNDAPAAGNTSPPPAASAPAANPPSGDTRLHDSLVFTLDPASLPFGPLAGTTAETDRWSGVLNGSGYRIEVPRNWNGHLVMYAHGYEGTDPGLKVSDIPIRRYLIENGYAWAASSFSKNGYDAQAGIEDTNALALAFTTIAAQNNRPLAAPRNMYIVGASMGGHVAAAAVERETMATARNKVAYNGAVAMCGVVGDTELFNYATAYQLAAQYIAGQPATSYPVADFDSKEEDIKKELWVLYPSILTDKGRQLRSAFVNLTGGPRPIAEDSFRLKPLQEGVWRRFNNDGTLDGVLNRNVVDTRSFVYQLDDDPAQSVAEQAMNANILRVTPAPDANPPRAVGLRWVPKVNGQFDVPVVTLHGLGDLFVPFSMEQIYKRRAQANGSDQWLVQRAIRAPGHCDFTVAEQVEAFQAMATWHQTGVKPAGDDVLTPAVVANPAYGCTFTRNNAGQDDSTAIDVSRRLMPSCP